MSSIVGDPLAKQSNEKQQQQQQNVHENVQRKPISMCEHFDSELPLLVSRSFTGTERAPRVRRRQRQLPYQVVFEMHIWWGFEKHMSNDRTIITEIIDIKPVMQREGKRIGIELALTLAGSM
ncbi:hypothetical protein PHYBLDRAFT_140224 [Phycomyces blakesleeanus NRRL 1555(-)]|uniref:Uncharacterized protein n=1 Tax=Phycomyces blakesleeanus (strain ATCC 8743b / DSM 1359 / FGSC 10004 / NBRC 33097 / NRRL 1555) TaxID=763407 RepID=A0A162V5X6_PHYB8|nr:hypothetical protein PHYBLDRAFT_140224 [Phycomyces blakesleeanus NRRL 1555(-)]OAD80223.1 hypothetical protein PHYBLDRAFT_140224 [Phycomyces blakesleeanus NRRL 1555(-)]|eukprot:XP_018298263.1 hypothetical protein PHYBLDRAFT_140224 [Phycomyces blakesleeanus NRRL 1555(-)]